MDFDHVYFKGSINPVRYQEKGIGHIEEVQGI